MDKTSDQTDKRFLAQMDPDSLIDVQVTGWDRDLHSSSANDQLIQVVHRRGESGLIGFGWFMGPALKTRKKESLGDRDDLRAFERLRENRVSTPGEQLIGFVLRKPGDQEHRRVLKVRGADPVEEVNSTATWHPEVGQHDVDRDFVQHLPSFGSVGGLQYPKSIPLKTAGQDIPQIRFVIDDQNRGHHGATLLLGSSTTKQVLG